MQAVDISAYASAEQRCEQLKKKLVIEQARFQYLQYAEENAKFEVMQQQRAIEALTDELKKAQTCQAVLLSKILPP